VGGPNAKRDDDPHQINVFDLTATSLIDMSLNESLADLPGVPRNWTSDLAAAIAQALREFSLRVGSGPLAMLALDCHPWNGSIGLAALTASEAAADRSLANPAEMAAWRHFDFARELPSWEVVSELGKLMKSEYEAGDRPAVAAAFLQSCATALTSQRVRESLKRFRLAEAFRLSVAHPDDGREFVA
jgi:hypothetical protein